MNLLKLFKKPQGVKPLPEYPRLHPVAIPACSALLFYGGNKMTELAGNRLYSHPYRPPAFHAAVYIEDGLMLNVGKFKTLQDVTSELRSTRRVDVLIYKKLTAPKRQILQKLALLDTTKPKVGITLPDYGVSDYLRFGLAFLKPSKKDFCSENVVELFGEVGIKTSDLKAVDTAPWDLLEYAQAHSEEVEIRTIHIGPEFKA